MCGSAGRCPARQMDMPGQARPGHGRWHSRALSTRVCRLQLQLQLQLQPRLDSACVRFIPAGASREGC